jgi:hypothetical protein
MLVWGAQVETGSTATAYQRVGLTSDVTESGKRDCWGLLFDGSDDSLQTSEISFNTWTQATRRNLLTDTESFGTSNWVNNGGTVTENTTVAPDGTTTADTLTRSSNALDGRYQTVTFTGDGVKAISFYVKKGTSVSCGVWLFDSTASANRILASFDLSGSVPVATITAGTDFAYSDAGNGWWRISMLSTTVTAANTNRVYLFAARGTGTADGETSIFWGVQAENAASATDYQRVGTDKTTVMAGVRKLSDATRSTIVELGADVAQSFGMEGPSTFGVVPDFSFYSRGTTQRVADGSNAFSAPITAVVTGTGDIAGDSTILRINGVQNASNLSDQGTGNYGNLAVYVGSRAGSSLRFNGIIYTLIVRGASTPTGTIADFEKNLLRLRAGLGAF